ncbi:MAG: ATP phosphoribosyltransferase [Anaerovoracaceae bacterium]
MIRNFIPEGVADINYEEYEKMHRIQNCVTDSFQAAGYRRIMTPTFEYYDLFADDGISSDTDQMYKIIDKSGKLMVLRPDATIPIARMMATHYKPSEGSVKLMYVSNIYRSADFRALEKREFRQAGIECFGAASPEADADVIDAAVAAVKAAGFEDIKTEIGDSGYFNGLVEELKNSGCLTDRTGGDASLEEELAVIREQTGILRQLVESKNIPGIEGFIRSQQVPQRISQVLLALPFLYGTVGEVTEKASAMALNDRMKAAVENLKSVAAAVKDSSALAADMSLINSLEYYSGMIFKIYLKKSGVIIGSGGRYDRLMKKFGKDIPAVGFGLNLETLYEASERNDDASGDMLTIALGKGRLADTTMKQLAAIGITFPEYTKESRKLIFDDASGKIRIVFVKAVDVGIYVEKGACDVGVIGKDTLLESGSDVFEMMDLGYGKCIFAVAAPKGFAYNPKKKLRVATKYPAVAKEYFAKQGRSIEIIKINGSVELAPIVGLSDVIVDIVETGNTLRENGLEVVEEVTDISARFIVNRASLKTKEQQVADIMEALKNRE